MEGKLVDPLSYATDADQSVLEEIARLDGLRESIRADQADYLNQHPEIGSLLNGFIRAVVEQKPPDVFKFAREHFAPDMDGVDAVVIAGPSGVGKGTIIRKLMEKYPRKFGFGCSHTTRARREGEEEAVHYHFASLESMREGVARGDFIEHAEVHGNLYGTSVSAVVDVTRRGQVCLLDIDVQGVKAVKASSLQPKYVFIAPPSMEVLEDRLRKRGSESEDSLSARLNNASEEIEYGRTEGNFDVLIENDDLHRAVEELSSFLAEWFTKISVAEPQHGEGGGDGGKLEET